MFKDIPEAGRGGTASTDATTERSHWVVGPGIGRGPMFRNHRPIPAGAAGQDALNVVEPGTPEEIASDEFAVVVRQQEGADWSAFPTPRRRRERRYEVAEDRIWIQWWADGEFNGLSARLINVSRRGALIVAGTRLADRQALRVVMEDPDCPYGVDAVVLGVVEGALGMHMIRLGFLTACPDEFFAAVADGFEAWLSRSLPH